MNGLPIADGRAVVQTGAVEPPVLALIRLALGEDVGTGDVTACYFVPESRRAHAVVVAREAGVMSGIEVAAQVFREVDAATEVTVLAADGTAVTAGHRVLDVRGAARALLTAERTALNFLQHLSGVASLTRRYVEAVAGTGARILDTRKTTPGWRWLEKQAVVHGGGSNHRMGLYDRAMVKDNHLVGDGGADFLQTAIRRLKAERPEVEVELEADSLEQVAAFLRLEGVAHVLLDNMPPAEMRRAVAMRGDHGRPLFEASGGIKLDTVRQVAECGVDFVSVGALTHSAPAMDIGLDFCPDREVT